MVNFVIANQKLTGSALHIEKKSEYKNLQNIGQGHWVEVRALRVYQGQLLCKVSHSQLPMMGIKPNFDVKINKVNRHEI